MRILVLLLAMLVSSHDCFAARYGLMIGLNYASFAWTPAGSSYRNITDGIGLGGGAMVSFFQDNLFGLRVFGILNSIHSKKDGVALNGGVPLVGATVNLSIDQGAIRYSGGIGYGYESFAALQRHPNFPDVNSAAGPILDLKTTEKNKGVFAYALGMLPMDSKLDLSYIGFLGVGYELGGSSK